MSVGTARNGLVLRIDEGLCLACADCLARRQCRGSAIRIIDRYCALLAQGLGGLITVFRPQVVIVGGGISHAGAPLFDRLHALVPQFVFAHEQIGTPDIRPAALGNEAGIVGAAFLDRA